MANKEALRELQGRLAERLQEVQRVERTATWLAVECAEHAFLFPLAEAGEIFPPTTLVSVPHTQPWFLGVANLRGALTGVVDLASFLGLRDRVSPSIREQGRVVAFNPALELNGALLVDKLAGLRNAEQLTPVAVDGPARPPFVGGEWVDASGRVWQELRLSMLPREERFLRIVAAAGG